MPGMRGSSPTKSRDTGTSDRKRQLTFELNAQTSVLPALSAFVRGAASAGIEPKETDAASSMNARLTIQPPLPQSDVAASSMRLLQIPREILNDGL